MLIPPEILISTEIQQQWFLLCNATPVHCMPLACVCLSTCHKPVLSKRLNLKSRKQHHMIAWSLMGWS